MEISNTTKTEPQIITIDTNTLLIQDKSTLRLIEGFMNYPDGYLSHKLTWNDIMPVVEKISKTKIDWDDDEVNETYYTRTFGMLSPFGNSMVRINVHVLFEAPTLIEATLLAVIDFIQCTQNK